MRDSVLNGMVDDLLLKQYASDAGYRTSDAALREYLEVIPYFQENGHFSAQRYKELLAARNETPEQFEAQQRQDLPVEQLRGSLLDSAFVVPVQTQAAWGLDHQERLFSYAKFEAAKFQAGITIGDDQVKQRYEQNKANYMAPERIKLAYIDLALDQLPKAAPLGSAELKAIYDAEKASRFSTPEQRHASHILIRFGADKAAAQKKAQDLYDKIKGGADFAQLAKDNSEDPGSKAKGGDLGWVKRGMMAPKFESALFGIDKAGELAGPVETEFGWHVIKLDELKPAQTQAFEDPEVQKQLLEIYQGRDASKRFQDMSSKLEQLAFENPNSLDAAAKALELPVKTTDWFSRKGGSDVAGNQAVIAAAFSPEVQRDGENSKPISIDSGRIVVVRKADYEAPRQLQLNEVADQIRTDLKNEAAAAKLKAAADALLKTLHDGQTFDAAVKAQGLVVLNPGAVARDNKTLDAALLDTAFKMPRPAAGKLSYAQATLGNGDLAVVALSAVNQVEAASTDAAQVKTEASKLRDAEGGAEFAAFKGAIHKEIKVDIRASVANTDIDQGN
jgi:peptidyl-prolyl cis-trans isomerase D